MQLAELQRRFQARVLTRSPGIEPELTPAAQDDFDDRLGAYVGGYRARLVEAMGTTYAALRATLGEDGFEELMRGYIELTPSTHYSIRYYGASLPAWIASHGPDDTRAVLAELALWEWTLADVFDAPDDAPLAVEDLAAVRPEHWHGVCFDLRACVRRVGTRTNAVECWRVAGGHRDGPVTPGPAPDAQWLVWRRGLSTLFRSLDQTEALAVDALSTGVSFGELCERLAAVVDPNEVALRAATLLRGWIAEELILDYRLPQAPC